MIRTFLFFFCMMGISLAAASPSPVQSADSLALFQLYNNDAEPVISEALAKQGAGENVEATIYGHDPDKPLVSHDGPIEVEIHGLRFDNDSKRWSANMLVVNGEEVVTAIPIAGRYEEVVSLPVLRRQLRSGDTISEDDVEMQNFPLSQIRGEVVTQAEALIGQTPVRTLSSERPIRTHEVSGPILVKKSSLVKIRYSIPGMEISDTGEAMEDGSRGSLINVRNTSSKKLLRAVVTGEGSVSIPTRSSQTAEDHELKGDSHATN